MRIHILGIAGTFMAGIARLAHQAGCTVSGSDENIYPPMSTQLEQTNVRLYPNDQLPDRATIDHYIVGNVMRRGMPIVEQVLDSGIPYSSGPEWLYRNVLSQRKVLAVAGTHGKTTTSAMLAWILRAHRIDAGFLIGGVARDLPASAELGSADWFVIEADEYDTAFFDKRPKFLHYQPEILILNNLEHDHLDIYPRLSDMRKVFHYLLRQLPGRAQIIVRHDDPQLRQVIAQGVWSKVVRFNCARQWHLSSRAEQTIVRQGSTTHGELKLRDDTPYNRLNALAALIAADLTGTVKPVDALRALSEFRGVKRRLERLCQVGNTSLYEDFAHHPTAVAGVIDALRARIDQKGSGRLLLLIELGSYTMRSGRWLNRLMELMLRVDRAWLFTPSKTLYNEANKSMDASTADRVRIGDQPLVLLSSVRKTLRSGDQIILLTNGHFHGCLPEIRAQLTQTINSLTEND